MLSSRNLYDEEVDPNLFTAKLKKPSLGQGLRKSLRKTWRLHKKEIIAGFVTAAVLTAAIIAVGIVCWPLLVALVPATAAVAIGSALGISAFTAATALAATVFAVVSAAVVGAFSAIASVITRRFSAYRVQPYYERIQSRPTDDYNLQPPAIGGSSFQIGRAVGGLGVGSFSDDKVRVSISTSEDTAPSKSSSSVLAPNEPASPDDAQAHSSKSGSLTK